MSDQYLQQLTSVADVQGTYVIPMSDDPSGTGNLKKATMAQVATYLAAGAFSSLGVGVSSASAGVHVIKTTEQLRLGYDASNYVKVTVGSSGAVTFDAIGSGAVFSFSDKVGFSKAVPAYNLHVASPATIATVIAAFENGATEGLELGHSGSGGLYGVTNTNYIASTYFTSGSFRSLALVTGNAARLVVDTSGNTVVGHTGTALAKLESRATSGAQIVGSYDASNYWSATTSSAGAITFDAVGASAGFIFSDALSCSSSILSSSASGGVGYKTGAGGAVTQTTSKSTSVTLNTMCGQITTHTETIAAGNYAIFYVYNSNVTAQDVICINTVSGHQTLTTAHVFSVGSGSFRIKISNGAVSDGESGAIVISFAIIKAVTS